MKCPLLLWALAHSILLAHRDIIRMHRLLTRDIDIRTGCKRLPNVIYRAEKAVETTLPENVEKEMTKLLEWYHSSKLHPLELAAIFHGRFEKIHPFEDGMAAWEDSW